MTNFGTLENLQYINSTLFNLLTYGVLLWGSGNKSHLKMIDIIQKGAIRNIMKAKYNYHTLPFFKYPLQCQVGPLYQLYL